MLADKALIKDLANCLAGTSNLIAAGSASEHENDFYFDQIAANTWSKHLVLRRSACRLFRRTRLNCVALRVTMHKIAPLI